MILRRLAAALRTQDWFTVVVEFAIVVAGIFVALQVDDWNENRIQRAQERVNLERLLNEAENSVVYIEEMVSGVNSLIESQRKLLEIMSSDTPLPQDTAAAEFGFESLNWFVAITPTRTVYDELEATGGLQLIRSNEVREAISVYFAFLQNFEAQLDYFRNASLTAGHEQFYEARDYVKASYDPTIDHGRRLEFDWPKLRADPYLRSMFVTKFRNQMIMNSLRKELLQSARSMCDAIAKEIDRKCTPGENLDALIKR